MSFTCRLSIHAFSHILISDEFRQTWVNTLVKDVKNPRDSAMKRYLVLSYEQGDYYSPRKKFHIQDWLWKTDVNPQLNRVLISARIGRNDFGLIWNVECATVVHFWVFFMNRYLHIYFLKSNLLSFWKNHILTLNRFTDRSQTTHWTSEFLKIIQD